MFASGVTAIYTFVSGLPHVVTEAALLELYGMRDTTFLLDTVGVFIDLPATIDLHRALAAQKRIPYLAPSHICMLNTIDWQEKGLMTVTLGDQGTRCFKELPWWVGFKEVWNFD